MSFVQKTQFRSLVSEWQAARRNHHGRISRPRRNAGPGHTSDTLAGTSPDEDSFGVADQCALQSDQGRRPSQQVCHQLLAVGKTRRNSSGPLPRIPPLSILSLVIRLLGDLGLEYRDCEVCLMLGKK